MIKYKTIIISLLISLMSNCIYSQDKNVDFGLKGGIDIFNYATVEPGRILWFQYTESIKNEVGFFLGGFSSIELDKSLYLHSELLFRLHPRSELKNNLELRLQDGTIVRYGFAADVKVTDFIIQVPVIIKYELLPNLRLGLGPQFTLILDQKYSLINNSIEEHQGAEVITDSNSDNFDLGLAFRASYNLTDKVGIFTGYNIGFIKREDRYNSSVIDFGVNFSLM